VLYSGNTDVTGLGDVRAVDPDTGETAILEPTLTGTFANEIYTSDSKYGLYLRVPNANRNVGALFAGNLRGSHQIGTSEGVSDVARAAGGLVSYLDTAAGGYALVVADPDQPDREPHVISEHVGGVYLPTGDRRRLVFTSHRESDGPGLYLAAAR